MEKWMDRPVYLTDHPGFCPFHPYSDVAQSPLGWPKGFWSAAVQAVKEGPAW